MEIAGFKSFARPARLEFPRGITAFVGPNGSGKSNIVDAIRWCLGEQSARELRGQRAEDAIYAGPRRVLGSAEVTLTFESEAADRAPWTELPLSRRLYRSGESEYLVNRERARLRDLLSSLRAVGIDSGRNVVVTQGMADALLSAGPLERRGLLEQAAGLGAYRERRDDARQKLSTTRNNIVTIEAVLAELEPRLRLLRRQARAVEEREEARARLAQRLLQWYAYRWQKVSQARFAAAERAERMAGERARAVETVRVLERRTEEALLRERAWHREVERAVEAAHEAERERDRQRQRLAEHEGARRARRERLVELEERLGRMEAEGGAIANRLAEVQGAIAGIEAERDRLREARARADTALQATHHALGDKLQTLASLEREKGRREAGRSRSARELEECQERVADLTERMGRLEGGVRDAEQELYCLDVDAELRGREHAEVAARCHELERDVAARGAALDSLGKRRARLEGLIRRTRSLLDDRRGARMAAERTIAGYESRASGSLIVGLGVVEGWEVAITAALGEWAFGGGADGGLRRASLAGFRVWRDTLDLAGCDAIWADTVVNGLPDDLVTPLAGTLLVESTAIAAGLWGRLAEIPAFLIGSPPLLIVAADGTVVEASGTRQAAGDAQAARYLAAKRIGRRASDRERLLADRVARLDEARLAVVAAEEAATRAHGSSRRALEGERSRLASLTAQLRRVSVRRDEVRHEREERVARGAAMRQNLEEAVAMQTTLAETDRIRRVEAEAAERAWRVARDLVASARDAVRELESRARELGQALDAAEGRFSIQEQLRADLAAAAARRVAEPERLREECVGLRADLERLDGACRELAASLPDLERRAVAGRERVVALRREGVALEGGEPSPEPARRALAEIIGSHERALATRAGLEAEARTLAEEITREAGRRPEDLPEPVGDPPTQDELRRLRARSVQYADTDGGVVAEARDLGARQQYLRTHLSDLEVAIENLEQIMAEADGEMRRRFARAFAAVSDEFSRVFTVMLRGGQAALELVGEGGVEVRAQLPGRRARVSAAFSGGERSLIASALLFGVLRIRPTPFCVLDEVDAALDEGNVDRYLAVLREISERTQILMVTHNRATMAAADVLYGLTMDDEGVSSVLSLKLDAYDRAG